MAPARRQTPPVRDPPLRFPGAPWLGLGSRWLAAEPAL